MGISITYSSVESLGWHFLERRSQVTYAGEECPGNTGHLETNGVVPPVVTVNGVIGAVMQGKRDCIFARRQSHGEAVAQVLALTVHQGDREAQVVAVGAEYVLAETVPDHQAQRNIRQIGLRGDRHIQGSGVATGQY